MTNGSALAPLRVAAFALFISCGLVLATLAADPETMRLAVVTPPPAMPGTLPDATMIAARPSISPAESPREPRGDRPTVRLATTSMNGLKLDGPRPAPRRVFDGPAKPEVSSRRVPDPLDWADFEPFEEPADEAADETPVTAVASREPSPLPGREPAAASEAGILRGFYSEESTTVTGGDGVGFFGSLPLIGSLPIAADKGQPQAVHKRTTLLLLTAEEATKMFDRKLNGQDAE